jgi:hypothetical protein
MMKERKDKRDHHLVLRGKIYWVRKRIPGTPKTYFKSLKTSDKLTARTRRTAHLRKLDAGVDEVYEKLGGKQSKHFATLGMVVEEYRAWSLHVNEVGKGPRLKTVQSNVGALVRMVAGAQGFELKTNGRKVELPDNLVNLPVTVINEKVADDYERFFWGLAKQYGRTRASTEVSVASALGQARAVFAERIRGTKPPMDWYKERGLNLPLSILEFRKACSRYNVKPAKYEKPPQALIEKTLAGGEKLRQESKALGAAFTLAYDLALRPSESAWVKWDWFEPRDDGAVAVVIKADPIIVGKKGGFQGPKHSTTSRPGRTIAIPRETFAWLRDNLWEPNGSEYVLPGAGYTERYRLIEEDLNAWMRAVGWVESKYKKASYELRKLKGSEYYVRLGAVQARNFLGHASVSTTEWSYAALGKDEAQVLYPQALSTSQSNTLFSVA